MANGSILAYPYANALFEMAKSENALDVWLSDLLQLAGATESKDFFELVNNPKLSKNDVSEVLLEFVAQKTPAVEQLLSVLQENDRLLVLPEIYTLFEKLVEEERNSATAIIQSAYAMNDATKNKFEQLLSKKFGKSITVVVEIKPELIGGIKVLINDTVIDYSVKGGLEKLATQLI